MVKHLVKKLERTFLLAFKALLFIILFVSFFGLFGLVEPELFRFSRTAGISFSTFAIAGICLTRIYGGFAIGSKKTKEIVYSLFLATFLTDVVTYFQLSIMRATSDNVNFGHDIFALVGIVLLQIIMINLFAYLGNCWYFKINPPDKVAVAYGSKEGLVNFVSKINKYKKQYAISALVSIDECLDSTILDSETIFLYAVSDSEKRRILEYCYRHNKTVYFTPELSDIITKHSHHVLVDDVTVLESKITGLTFEQSVIKRACD
ncbi:MAG: hypothetical protein RR977_03590, partial [Oscillospiraceae bacterium]